MISAIYELNKGERMIAAGKISTPNINRMKDVGAIRSKEKYMSGIDKGSEKLMNKNNILYKEGGFKNAMMGPHQAPQANIFGGKPIPQVNMTKNVSLPFRVMAAIKNGIFMSKKKYEEMKPLFKRHEVDESREFNKNPQAIKFMKGKKQVGSHASPKVLENEKKLVDYTTKAYGVGDKLKQMREKTGEYDFLDKFKNKLKNINKEAGKVFNDRVGKIGEEIKLNSEKIKSKDAKFIDKIRLGAGILRSFKNLAKGKHLPKVDVGTGKVS